jgi:hypothetical protein
MACGKAKSNHVFLGETVGFAQLLYSLTEGAKELSFIDQACLLGDLWPDHHEQISWFKFDLSLDNCWNDHSSTTTGRGSPRSSFDKGTSSAMVTRRRVFIVIGRPFSICCQCLAENPKEIISSWV